MCQTFASRAGCLIESLFIAEAAQSTFTIKIAKQIKYLEAKILRKAFFCNLAVFAPILWDSALSARCKFKETQKYENGAEVCMKSF